MGFFWGTSKEEAVASPLWEGKNLYERLLQSSWGKFLHFINGIGGGKETFAALPRIVVVGCESAGKSCLIENISKVAFFPRDTSKCTKYPIRLIINPEKDDDTVYIHFRGETITMDKSKVMGHMVTLMKEATSISREEITVTVYKKDFPAFEVIDLPGIREYPAEERQQSKDLVASYIQDPDTLVLVVVPATTPRLTANQAIGLVMEVGKQDKAVICLSMADLLQPCDIEEKLVKRLLNQTDELILDNWAGVVAIINRNHKDAKSLQEVNVEEYDFFSKLLEGAPPQYKMHAKTIRSSVTVEQVIRRLDQLFHRHICDHWKPRALRRIKEEIATQVKNLEELGCDPDVVDPNEILGELQWKLLTQVCPSNYFQPAGGELQNLLMVKDAEGEELIRHIKGCRQELIHILSNAILNRILITAQELCKDDQPPMKIRRFENIHEFLKKMIGHFHDKEYKILAKYITELLDSIRPDTFVLNFNSNVNKDVISRISIIADYIGVHIVKSVHKVFIPDAHLEYMREEREEVAQARSDFLARINDLQKRAKNIEELDVSV